MVSCVVDTLPIHSTLRLFSFSVFAVEPSPIFREINEQTAEWVNSGSNGPQPVLPVDDTMVRFDCIHRMMSDETTKSECKNALEVRGFWV